MQDRGSNRHPGSAPPLVPAGISISRDRPASAVLRFPRRSPARSPRTAVTTDARNIGVAKALAEESAIWTPPGDGGTDAGPELAAIADLSEVPVSLDHLRGLNPQTRIVIRAELRCQGDEGARMSRAKEQRPALATIMPDGTVIAGQAFPAPE
jgi:hypothetical protein